MAELKTKKTTASVAAFVDGVENEQRRADAKQLLKLFKEVTGMKPAMWGEMGVGAHRKGAGASATSRGRAKSQQRIMRGPTIIGYGVYHYKSERSSQEGDWPRAGFSPRKASLTIYIMPGFTKYAPLLKKLGKHTTSKSCLYINKLSDIDMPTLRTIIKETWSEMNRRYPAK